ncbi:MAG: MaoC family dehydratase [Bryobacteraceae bacterium]|jgi:acyl dehydratase
MTITLEELRRLVGQELAVTEWLEMTQERINLFADTTDDHQWIHVDQERARRESPYGATIAHGFLTLSLLPQIVSDAIQLSDLRMAVNYGLNRVRFPAAVRAGSRIRARIVLQSIREVEGATDAAYAVTIENEGSEKPCCVAEWLARYYK